MWKPFILFAAFCAVTVSCQKKSTEGKIHEEEQEPTFKVTSVIETDTVINKEYVSQIRAHQRIELRAQEKGYLENILVDEGQYVKKGQLLFQIQPTVYQAEVQAAQAEVEYERVEYDNTKALVEQDIVSANELALANAKLQKAQSELNLAKTHLGFTEIRAPFSGIVGKFEDVRLGSLLDEGELLTTLTDNSKMWVYFNVPEAEYLDYVTGTDKNGKTVNLRLANNSLYAPSGKIETIESDFNNETGNIAFRAGFSNPKRILRHGQTGTILWPKELHEVTLIPQKTTYEVLDKKFVFLVDSTGTVQSNEVKVEDELNHIYVIKGGLQPKDRFLLEGLRKVKSGEHIQTDYVAPEIVFADLHLHAE